MLAHWLSLWIIQSFNYDNGMVAPDLGGIAIGARLTTTCHPDAFFGRIPMSFLNSGQDCQY